MRLPVGQSDFGDIIKSDFDFVDKSLLIKEIIDDDQIILITRPRRFGKTLNLSMLDYFFNVQSSSESNKSLFNNLNISRESHHYLQHQAKYPVISFSFKDVKGSSFADIYAGIFEVVKELYDKHDYLLESKALKKRDKVSYEAIINQQAGETELQYSLKNLIKYLNGHYQTKVIVLIDEYDTPIQSAYLCNCYDNVIKFFRVFFGALKDNRLIFRAVLTGILRVAQESLFSGLNNLIVYSMLSTRYGSYFGFTEVEVENLLKASKLENEFEAVKSWYNGYQVGSHILYNPWSIANYIKERELQPYWINTSDNALIKELLSGSGDAFRSQFNPLLRGESIEQIINQNFVFAQLKKNREVALWSFLFMSGYLKVVDCRRVSRGLSCQLAIPNKEIGDLYRVIIEEWIAGERDFSWYDSFLKSLLNGDMTVFKEGLEYILGHTVSVYDVAHKPEAFYHGLIIGITASLCDSDTYELRSNKESGAGRYDYFIVSRNPNKLSILMEFKQAALDELESSAKEALAQIDMKNYLAEAEQRHILKVLKIGIAFNGKNFSLHSEIVSLLEE